MALPTRFKGNHDLYQPLADINVTPLVDVMLVLLIIFMVTAPLLAKGVKVNLPQASAAAPINQKDPIVVTVGKDGIEAWYEKDLRGQIGYSRIEQDAQGRLINALKTADPVPGKSDLKSSTTGRKSIWSQCIAPMQDMKRADSNEPSSST